MDEIRIDALQHRPFGQARDEVLAHVHERSRAAGREIEPAKQLLPARLRSDVEFVRRLVAVVRAIGGDRLFEPIRIGPETLGEGGEEDEPLVRRGGSVGREERLRERHPRRLAAPRQEQLAEAGKVAFDEGARAAQAEQRPPAFRERIDEAAKKGRRAAGCSLFHRLAWSFADAPDGTQGTCRTDAGDTRVAVATET